MTWAALLLMLSATPPVSVSLDGDSACAPRAVLARELQRTSLTFVDAGGELRVTLTPRDGVFSLAVRRGGAVALERQLKDGTCDDAGLATALILERYVRQVATPPLAEVVDAGVPSAAIAAAPTDKPKPADGKKKPKRGVKRAAGDAAAWSDPYRETPTAPPLPGDEGARGKPSATGSGRPRDGQDVAVAAGRGASGSGGKADELASAGSASAPRASAGVATGGTSPAGSARPADVGGASSTSGRSVPPAGATADERAVAGATTGRSASAAGGRVDDGVPADAAAGRSSSTGSGLADEPVPLGATAGRSSSTGSGRADEPVPLGATAGRSSSEGSGRAGDPIPPGATTGRKSSEGSGRADEPATAGRSSSEASGRADEPGRSVSGADGRADEGGGAKAAGDARSTSTAEGSSTAGASATSAGPSTTATGTPGGTDGASSSAAAASDASPPPRPGVRVEKAEVTHGEVTSTSPRRAPVRLTRWEVLAGAGAWTPTPATLSLAVSFDAAIVLDEHWRVALGGAFSFGGSVPVTDEAGATRGTLTARALLLAPAASWCTATRVRACGGVLAGLRLGIGSTAGDYIFQASTRWAPALTFGPTAQLSTGFSRFAAALDVALLVNPAPSRFTVEGLTARIDTSVVEVVARLSVGLGSDR